MVSVVWLILYYMELGQNLESILYLPIVPCIVFVIFVSFE
jgi:hypothetical protein